MRKVTIEDISRDTGLSRGTVSRALNDRPDISTKTKQKVLETCKRLKYVPSHAARSLATGRSYAVAVLVDDLYSSFTAGFLRGAVRRAEQARFAVHVVEISSEANANILAAISRDLVDGVLITAPLTPASAAELEPTLAERTVVSCAPIMGVTCDVVGPDQLEAGRMVGRLIADSGVRTVLYVQNTSADGAEERLAGFMKICGDKGVETRLETISEPRLAASERITEHLGSVDAIVASDDHTALTLTIACERANRRVGRDIAVIGHGDDAAAGLISPGLTTVDFDAAGIGRRAVETALRWFDEKGEHTPQHLRVAPALIRRESTAHFALARTPGG